MAAARPDRFYCGHAEQLPELPGIGGGAAIVEAIQKNLVYPAGGNIQGRVFASFTIRADGSVTNIEIVKGLADACDWAVIDAIGQLPRFVPGKQNGQAVTCRYTVPIKFAR